VAEIDVIRNRVETWGKVLNQIPEVTYVGDPILRTPTLPVTFEEGLKIGNELGYHLVRYRKIAGYGRGFAAPQIGINKSVFTTFVDNKAEIFINPKITDISETTNFYRELCLSSGIYYADVERPDSIEMEWTDRDNKSQRQKFDGFLARLYHNMSKNTY